MQPNEQPFKLPANPPDYSPKLHGRNLILIYLRKSYIKGKVDMISIQYQLDVTLPVAWRDQLRFRVFVDAKRSNSARSEHGRADWMRLKLELQNNPDCLGVMMAFQDRASRSTRDTIDLMEMCESRGLHFVIPLNGIDTRMTGWTPHIKSMIRSNANIAETESELTSGRMMHRIGQYNALGVPFGSPPFGMVRTGEGLDAIVKPNADAPAVIQCLRLFAGGLSYDAIATQMNRDRVPFRDRHKKDTQWRVESARTVVGNVLYYSGYILPLSTERTIACRLEGDGDFLQRHINATKARRTSHIEPVLSDEAEMRQLANSVIQRRIRPRSFRASLGWTPLLTPMLRWSGKKMRAFVDEGKAYYRTVSGAGRWFNAENLENQMLDVLAGLRFNPEALADIRASATNRHADASHLEIRAQIAELERWQAVCLNQLKHGRISQSDYEREWDEAQAAISKGRERLNDHTNVDQLLALLTDLGRTIRLMTPLKRKTSLSLLLEFIEVDDDGVLCAAVPRSWAMEAFYLIAAATSPDLGRVGLEPVSGLAKTPIEKQFIATVMAGMPPRALFVQ